MAKRIGVFIDTNNLYINVRRRFHGKLDFGKYLNFVKDLGEVTHAVAYGTAFNPSNELFQSYLARLGFLTRFHKPVEVMERPQKYKWEVALACDVMTFIDKLDIVILGSADPVFEPLVTTLRDRGVEVIVFATNIPPELKKTSTKWFGIFPDLLEKRTPKDSGVDDGTA